MAYYPEDERETEEELARQSQESLVNPPAEDPAVLAEQQAMEAKLKGMEDPERVARNAQARADLEKLNPTIDPNYQVDDAAPVPPPIDDVQTQDVLAPTLKQLESDANRQYDDALQQGRLRANEARFGAGLSYAGELLNQAFAGGPKAKPIDPFFQWLQQGAGQIGQDAEKDADRALRLELQKIRTLRKDKEVSDPASPENRNKQAIAVQSLKTMGYSDGEIQDFARQVQGLTGKNIDTAFVQFQKARAENTKSQGVGLRRDSLDALNQYREARLASTDFNNQLKAIGLEDKMAERVSDKLQKFNKASEDAQGAAESLTLVQDALKPFQDPKNPLPLPTVVENLLAEFPGRGVNALIDKRLGQREKTILNQAFQDLVNQQAHRIFGATLTGNEKSRMDIVSGNAPFADWSDKLEYLKLVQRGLHSELLRREAAFQLPEEVWNLATEQGLTNSRSSIFGGRGKPASVDPHQAVLPTPPPLSMGKEAIPRAPAPIKAAPPLSTNTPVNEGKVVVEKDGKRLKIPSARLKDAEADGWMMVQ